MQWNRSGITLFSIIKHHLRWPATLSLLLLVSGLTAQQQQRLLSLYETLDRKISTRPLPKRPPCPGTQFQEFADTPPVVKKWLTEAANLRENGALDCSERLLDALKPYAVKNDTDHIAWLFEYTRTLSRAEKIDSAIAAARQLSALAEHQPRLQGKAWLTEAQAVAEKRQFSETQRLAEKALVFARRNGDKALEIRALDELGNVTRDIYMTRPDKSVPPLLEAIEIAKSLRDTDFVIRTLSSVSLHYLDTDVEKGLGYLEQAANWLQPESALRSRLSFIRVLSYFFQLDADHERACRLLEQAIAISKYLGLRSSVQNDYENLADSYMTQGDAEKAQACLDSAYRYCNFQRELGYFYRSFAEVAAMRGDTTVAFDWYKKAFDEQVKGYNDRNTRQLTEWETRFRTREKELQLEDQKRQRWLLFGLVFTLASLFAGAVFAYFRQRKSHRKIAAQTAQIERQAAELRLLDEAKSRFFANVSHELRTPLTLIQGPVNEALRDNDLPPRIRRLLGMARENGHHLLELVNQLLDLNRFETVRPELREESTLLAGFLARIVAEFQSTADFRQINLRFETQADAGLWVATDRDKLQKILNNLLGNALKFTPPGGQIVVSLAVQNDRLIMRVSDTGPGIHPDDLPHIFERYYQSGRPGARAEGGFGIGLAYSSELAEVMGGTLGAENSNGQGSVFELQWPLKKAAAPNVDQTRDSPAPVGLALPPAADPGYGNPELAPSALPHLLIVEDNNSLQEYLQVLLSVHYRVTLTANGQAALDFLRGTPTLPDLIISDVMMPLMDGFELLDALRADPVLRGLPVILLTARAEPQDRLRAFRLGIDDYLQKPFDAEELLARLDNALRNRDIRREWQQLAGDLPDASSLQPAEDQWLSEARERTREHLGNAQFNVDYLASLMQTSRSTLNRRTRELTGMSSNQFIQELRLQTAREILESDRNTNLKTVAEAVGLRSPHYLSRLYKERYGKSPV